MDMSSLMQQAQQIQQNMAKVQEELAKKTVTGTAGGGMVTVTVNGKSEVLSVVLEKTVIDPNEAEMLQDLITAATNDALRRAKEMGKSELGKLTGGMNIPGLSNMF
ncbi:MAG: YbaB/EbfC family nucleoid-associated protein [Desulfobulbaceae bacterium]|uniref:Nucleoid-associated protein H8E79_06750 n=1 Tax=Candidatus Desulfatifera sulfidica TaxID=2841691 RepID=A0A8J6NB51_9BACT|nr:YbaB/EbfC family nucleoid-associated protein [Candidatus Desulfatifera sulfidica]